MEDTGKMKFEQFHNRKGRGRSTWLSELQIGEFFVLENKTWQEIRARIWQHQRLTSKKFAYLKCKNGIVLERVK